MRSLHTFLNTAHSGCKPSTSMSSSTHFFQVSLFFSLHLAPATSAFYRPTPNHPHSYAPDAQSTSICHASPHTPHSAHSKDCKNPHCVSYLSMTPRTAISPSSFLQTSHGCSPESSARLLTLHHMIFVFPAFTFRPFFSIPSFHFLTLSSNNSSE